jgi:hypothetical protein
MNQDTIPLAQYCPHCDTDYLEDIGESCRCSNHQRELGEPAIPVEANVRN